MDETMKTARLVDDLISLGVQKGDTLYVHSSLKKIGWLENGPQTLLDALLEAVGPQGTIAVPTHSLCYVNIGVAPFQVESSSSYLGTFPEFVRKHPLSLRSAHPSHSSAAIGKNAKFLTENHDLSNALGYHSPLHRIYRTRGKVLLLGVDHGSNTMLHLAESLAKTGYETLPYNAAWGPEVQYVAADGSVKRVRQTEFPGCSGHFTAMEGIFQYLDIARYGRVGNAVSQLLDAKPMVDVTVKVLKKRPDFLLCYRASCSCCQSRRALLNELYGLKR